MNQKDKDALSKELTSNHGIYVTKWNDGYRVATARPEVDPDNYSRSPVFVHLIQAQAYACDMQNKYIEFDIFFKDGVQTIYKSCGEYPPTKHTMTCWVGAYVVRPMSNYDAEHGQGADYSSEVWGDVKDLLSKLYGRKNVHMDDDDHDKQDIDDSEYYPHQRGKEQK